MLFASIFIQAATNMFNEYFDYKRGLDDENMVGIAGAIVRDGMTPGTVLKFAWTCIGIAVALGIYICVASSWWVAVVGVCCMIVAYFYSAGSRPLAYTPVGELASAVCMGPGIVLLAFFVQTHTINARAALLSLPIGLLIGLILLANNLRDLDQDKAGGRRTLAIVLGRRYARVVFAGALALTYVSIAALVISETLTPWALIAWITIPSSISIVKMYYTHTEPQKLHKAVKGTANLLFHFGMLMFAGIIISLL